MEAFEPDYVVRVSDKISFDFAIEKWRVLSLADIVGDQTEPRIGYGLNVFHLFKHLYRSEFQFARRHPVRVIYPSAREHRFDLFVETVCGTYPKRGRLAHLRRNYEEVFEPDLPVVDHNNGSEIAANAVCTPLNIGSWGLRGEGRGSQPGSTLFLIDATSIRDLTDFWNLRAIGYPILPVAKQWADAYPDAYRALLDDQLQELTDQTSLPHSKLIKSRSIAEGDALSLVQKLAGDSQGRIGFQRWYPRIWDEWARDKDHVTRTSITSNEADLDLPVRNNIVAIPSLAPDFVDETAGLDERWVNIVNFRDFSGSGNLATVIPPSLQNAEDFIGYVATHEISAGSEGLILRRTPSRLPTYLKIPDGFSVFSAWFAQHGLQAKVSDAGRVAEQILASLEGIEGGWALANKEVVSLLNEMAQGLAEATPIDESSQSERKPIPRGRAVPRERWLELLGKLYQDNGRAKRHLDFLLTHGVLKIGARVECPRCRQANWYPLDDMGEELRCERCLRYYAFPAVEPPKNLWYYRTNGPFSIESYARGSYSAVLALRALSGRFGRRAMTWATGIQIGAGDAKDLEADFVVWQRDLWLGQIKSWLIFGEAKSFADGAFKPKDIERAKALAKQFPGAVLVFATMRTELNAEEKKRLSKLALWGRYGIGNDRTRAPVLILTATELFANAPPPGCWVGHGERFQPFVNAFGVRGSLPQLCNATQQLHLDMESYGVWSQRYWERRHRRRAARNKALADA